MEGAASAKDLSQTMSDVVKEQKSEWVETSRRNGQSDVVKADQPDRAQQANVTTSAWK